jgi:hypothetical protein
MAAPNKGELQISVWDGAAWSDWEVLRTVTGYTPNWHHALVDLSAYAGERVRLGFYHEDGTERNSYGQNVHSESAGWYLDDVVFERTALP